MAGPGLCQQARLLPSSIAVEPRLVAVHVGEPDALVGNLQPVLWPLGLHDALQLVRVKGTTLPTVPPAQAVAGHLPTCSTQAAARW